MSKKLVMKFYRLKYYFNVNNQYVLRKLKIIMMPLSHKVFCDANDVYLLQSWKRERSDGGMEGDGSVPVYKPARDDINAPDLYIPVMAFVTYILLMGYSMGRAGQ